MRNFRRLSTSAIAIAIGLTAIPLQQSQATEGYFQNGNGARHKALAGAGVADTRDSTAMAINPAGILGIGKELNLAITIFSPRRKYTGSGDPGFTPNGTFKSDSNYFPIPDFSYVSPIDDVSSWGIALTANGGMNTDWAPNPRPLPDCPPAGGAGIFCAGLSGVNMSQAFLSVVYARQMGAVKIGIQPILSMTLFRGRGVLSFAGFSADPANMSDRGTDYIFGYGIKIGFQADLGDSFRVGANYQSRINQGKFGKYAGLFAQQGSFDIPQNFTIGLAMDLSDQVTVMLDYKWIDYSSVQSIANSPFLPVPFGADGGPGFGWKSINVFKFGLEFRQSDDWTWRLGFAKNENPIGTDDVMLNILAPGLVTTHITGGFSYTISERSKFNFAAGYIPTNSVTGPEGPGAPFSPGHIIRIEMKQFEATFGWTRSF